MADEQLFRARREFVKRASPCVVEQLLDDLLEENVVNDGEMDDVMFERVCREDIARHLIDTVRRKGPAASKVLIKRLRDRDPSLYKQLKLTV